jgi:hypothetical protein
LICFTFGSLLWRPLSFRVMLYVLFSYALLGRVLEFLFFVQWSNESRLHPYVSSYLPFTSSLSSDVIKYFLTLNPPRAFSLANLYLICFCHAIRSLNFLIKLLNMFFHEIFTFLFLRKLLNIFLPWHLALAHFFECKFFKSSFCFCFERKSLHLESHYWSDCIYIRLQLSN